MFKISFGCVVDVARFVEAFGANALPVAFKNTDDREVVRDALKVATTSVVEYNSFNDGNVEWEEVVDLADGSLENMSITRYGWGSHTTPLMQYLRDLADKCDLDSAESIARFAVEKGSSMRRLECLVGINL